MRNLSGSRLKTPRLRDGIRKCRRRRARSVAALVIALVIISLWAPVALAHGVELSYKASEGIEVTALYDNGEPLSSGQVTVYAPDELSEPWLTGTCDDEGKFFFVPDPEIPGTWEVKVRQAGHGGIIRIAVEKGSVESGGGGGFTVLQKVVMSLAVLWGLIGTALFFSRRKRDAHP